MNTISSNPSSVKNAETHGDFVEQNANLTALLNGTNAVNPSESNEEHGDIQENNGTIPENRNKTLIDAQKNQSTENREIEDMFNAAVHEAFIISQPKQELQEQSGRESPGGVQKSFSSPNIHTDSGLLLSENEVDTIDDAPDTSEEDTNNLINNQTNQSVTQPDTDGEPQSALELGSGNYSVDKDVEDKEINKTVDDALVKVAGEILKMKDSDAVLKALSDIKNPDMLENDSAISPNDHVSPNQNDSNDTIAKNHQNDSNDTIAKSHNQDNNDIASGANDNQVNSNMQDNNAFSVASDHGRNTLIHKTPSETPFENNDDTGEQSDKIKNNKADEQMSFSLNINADLKGSNKKSSSEQSSSMSEDNDDKAAEKPSSSDENDSEGSGSQIQLLDNEVKAEPDDNNNGNDDSQKENENVYQSINILSDKGNEVNMENTKSSAFENSLGSGSEYNDIEENPRNESTHGYYDTVNLHALNALVEILAENENNASVKKNETRKNNATMMKIHNNNLPPESGTHGKASVLFGTTNHSNLTSSKLPFSTIPKNHVKDIPGYLNSGGAKVPKGNIVRNANSSKLTVDNSSLANGNNIAATKDDSFDHEDISVKEIFNTGMDMLRNYANGEGKHENGNSKGNDAFPKGKTASEEEVEAPHFKQNVPNYGNHVLHTENDIINLKENISKGKDDNVRYQTSRPIESDEENSKLNKHSSGSTADSELRNKTSKPLTGTKHKPRPSLFEVLKEVVSTFTKLSYNLKNRTSEKNSTFNKDITESTPVNSQKELGNFTSTKPALSDDEKTRFSLWTGWTECSKSCGEGYKIRQRRCLSKEKDCEGLLKQNRTCSLRECPGK